MLIRLSGGRTLHNICHVKRPDSTARRVSSGYRRNRSRGNPAEVRWVERRADEATRWGELARFVSDEKPRGTSVVASACGVEPGWRGHAPGTGLPAGIDRRRHRSIGRARAGRGRRHRRRSRASRGTWFARRSSCRRMTAGSTTRNRRGREPTGSVQSPGPSDPGNPHSIPRYIPPLAETPVGQTFPRPARRSRLPVTA